MNARRIVIKSGQVCGFADEVAIDGVRIETVTKTRVSHVWPANIALRAIFIALRAVVRDESKVAGWTRTWGGIWKGVIDREEFGPFSDRSEAIRFEKQKIYEQGKLK